MENLKDLILSGNPHIRIFLNGKFRYYKSFKNISEDLSARELLEIFDTIEIIVDSEIIF